jgi:DNA-binding MarR family transcriptional regulator
MSIYMNYYVLSPQGRKKFEEWQQIGITTGPHYQIVEYLYKKNAATVSQISQGTKLSPKEVIPQIEAFTQAGYLMAVEM